LSKKPKRPSERVEIYSVAERMYLKKFEEPFEKYSELVNGLPANIKINQVKNVRQDVAKRIEECWLFVEKVSATITKRRSAFLCDIPEKDRKKINFNAAFVKTRIEEIKAGDIEYLQAIQYLSPIPLLAKLLGGEEVAALSTIKWSSARLVIPDIARFSPEVNGIFDEYVKTFALDEIRVRQHKREKASARKVEHFSDEEETYNNNDVQKDDN